MEHLRLRIILDIVLLIGLFIFPFWISAIIALIGLIAIPYYWEALIFLALADLLYHGGASPMIRYGFPLLAALGFLVLEVLRGYLRENSPIG